MPPKARFTREQVVCAGLELVRRDGMDGLTARALAAHLGCSVKPIFCLFSNMEEVQQQVLCAADARYQAYLQADMAAGSYPPYKASGMAYIRFAREESALFRLLFMRDRRGERISDNREEIRPLIALICQNLGINEAQAYLFHLEMWVYVHGIAAMVATGYLDWQEDFISRTLTDAYMGLRLRYLEENHGSNPND